MTPAKTGAPAPRQPHRRRTVLLLVLLSALLVALPLAGVWLAGEPIAPYLELPPSVDDHAPAPFSLPAFLTIGALAAAALGFVVFLAVPRRRPPPAPARRRLPWWGWAALAVLLGSWVLAWTRFEWFAPWQALTFPPLWLSYIVFINAWTRRRAGHCLLVDRTRFFLALFPLSALFWWYFEYLNRYVQNWVYFGTDDFGPLAYAVHSTLAFSTVLPGVLSTLEWLSTFPRLRAGYARPFTLPYPRAAAWAVLLCASAGLVGLGVWPTALFPLLWLAPLLLLVALQVLLGMPPHLAGLASGEWERVYLPALAALVCGVLWEMWNYYSLAHWQYRLPYVHRYEIFEMPLLGYAGYLPFGLECAAVADLLRRATARAPAPVPGLDPGAAVPRSPHS